MSSSTLQSFQEILSAKVLRPSEMIADGNYAAAPPGPSPARESSPLRRIGHWMSCSLVVERQDGKAFLPFYRNVMRNEKLPTSSMPPIRSASEADEEYSAQCGGTEFRRVGGVTV